MDVKKNWNETAVETLPNQSVTDLLLESQRASQAGDNQYAYELSLQATRIAPENVEAWLLRVALSPSFEERMICVNRLNELAPDHHDRYNLGHFTLRELLDRNPFLAYHEETDELYRVIHANQMMVSIRKKRAPAITFLAETASPLKNAYRWLMLAALGLLFAGLGTFIFAPLAGLSALQVGRAVRSRADRVNSIVVLTLAVILFMIGAGFTYLFALHWAG